MSDYEWCHGPKCHERKTTTRVRGVKGSKVLRTVKIALNQYRNNSPWKYFCDQTCMHDFIYKHINEFVELHPRTEPLETPIDVEVVNRTDWHGNPFTTKEIKAIDNA
jgi:hypothetical protein|tara:strand:+ start:95 stop:415 length:321 start_codon:yes stop_codon:yes gene_type:complete